MFGSKCNQYWLLETRKKRKNKLKVVKNAKTCLHHILPSCGEDTM
jgi:endonuclease I